MMGEKSKMLTIKTEIETWILCWTEIIVVWRHSGTDQWTSSEKTNVRCERFHDRKLLLPTQMPRIEDKQEKAALSANWHQWRQDIMHGVDFCAEISGE